jgi:uncharacterized protein with von Willebrand factor type A (vWA) domain
LVDFLGELRSHGVDATVDGVRSVLRALDTLTPNDAALERFVDASVDILATSRSDRAAVHAALMTWLGIRIVTADDGHRAHERTESRGAIPVGADEAGELASESSDLPALLPGSADRLSTRDHRDLTPEERAQVAAYVERIATARLRRRSRRDRAASVGRIDMPSTVREIFRNGGEVARLHYRRPRRQAGRTLLLIDVSKSMNAYSESLLRLSHALVRARPGRSEVFSFGTRLTRLTAHLSHPNPDVSLAAGGGVIPDWGGGTVFGTSLIELIRRWGKTSVVRSAHCVIASDGWCSDPSVARVQLPRLALLTRRLTWADPQAGVAGYRACAEVTRDLQQYFSELVPCHSGDALLDLADLVAGCHRS